MRKKRAEFFRRKRPDGSEAPTLWTRIGGKPVSTKTSNLKAAKRWKERRLIERADPRRAAAETHSLGDAIRAMKAELRRRGRADGTLERCDQKLAHFARLWGEGCKLSTVDAEKVGEYIDTRLGDEGLTKGKPVARITIRDELAFLRQLLKLARRQGKYPYAIEDVMPLVFETGHKARKDFVVESKIQDLLGHVIEPHAAHLLFFMVTAGRLADSYRAQRTDFDTTKWTATVRGSKTDGSFRTIPIEPFMRPLVQQMLDLAEDYVDPTTGDKLLFPAWQNIGRNLPQACDRAGIPRVSTNGLRRTFGTMFRIRGYSLETISKMFGHTTLELCREVYADLEGEELKTMLEAERARLKVRIDTGREAS